MSISEVLSVSSVLCVLCLLSSLLSSLLLVQLPVQVKRSVVSCRLWAYFEAREFAVGVYEFVSKKAKKLF